tara:strand:+ start:15 stop:578 length:564 start_codon:yes stop_codon:yes gene_type:complete
MNIFYLHENPRECAKLHCDKHVTKMIVEYAQLLSTAHRVLNGEQYIDSSSGRRIKRWKLDDVEMENNLYKASFINHPSAVWVRASEDNYRYLANLWYELCLEYEYRFWHNAKKHKTFQTLQHYLPLIPKNIDHNKGLTEMPQCMPDDVKADNAVDAYRNYYVQYKKSFAKWTDRPTPNFMEELKDVA